MDKEYWTLLDRIATRIRDGEEDIKFIKKMKGESEENDKYVSNR
jgi:hypothetical protein